MDGGFNVFVAPILSSLAWFSGGAALVEITAPTVVPLVHAVDDPRPRVSTRIGTRSVDVVLDMASSRSRVGRLWAIRLGLDTRRRRGHEVAVVPEVRIGDVVLRDLRVDVVAEDEVVLGLQGLTELAMAVHHSRGSVRWVRAGDGAALLNEVGEPRNGTPPWSSDAQTTRAEASDREVAWFHGAARVSVTPTVAGHELAPLWALPGRPRAGADALVQLDLAVWPAEERWSAGPHGTALTDNAVRARDRRESEAERWDPPPPFDEREVSPLEGAKGSAWRSERAADLSDLRRQTGDVDGAVDAAIDAVGWGEDRCAPWVALGERLLRSGTTRDGTVRGVALNAVDVLIQGRRLLRAWEGQPSSERGVGGFAVRQPATCRRVHGLLAEAYWVAGAWDELDGLEHPAARVVRGAARLRRGDLEAAIAELTTSVAESPDPHPLRDALLGLAQARAGRPSIARTAICGGPREGLALAALRARVAAAVAPEDNGAGLLSACAQPGPGHLVMQRVHGVEDGDLPGAVAVARRPRVAEVAAAAWVASALWGGPELPRARAAADAVVAELLVAQAEGRSEDVRAWRERLSTHWPLLDGTME